jgi:hypothetical protein
MVDVSDKAMWRRFRLSDACRRGVPLTIDGIAFDLNHPDLDRANWEPVDLLGAGPWIGIEPPIVYPWTSTKLAKRLVAEKGAPKLVKGDRLVIRRVVTFDAVAVSSGKLDHQHHRERRLIYLAIERGGETIPIQDFWLFAGIADVLTPIFLDELNNVRYALIHRLEAITGMVDLDDALLGVSEDDWNARFAALDDNIRLAARMLWKAEDYQDHAGMAFGYLIGRAEAREGRQALAKSASKNVRSTGDKTRARAIEVIDETPGIILRRCAERVAGLTDKNVKSVRETIKPLFHETADGSFRPNSQEVEACRARLERQASVAKVRKRAGDNSSAEG